MEITIGIVILIIVIMAVRAKKTPSEEEGLQYPIDAPGRSVGELYINYEDEDDDDDYMDQVMSSDSGE